MQNETRPKPWKWNRQGVEKEGKRNKEKRGKGGRRRRIARRQSWESQLLFEPLEFGLSKGTISSIRRATFDLSLQHPLLHISLSLFLLFFFSFYLSFFDYLVLSIFLKVPLCTLPSAFYSSSSPLHPFQPSPPYPPLSPSLSSSPSFYPFLFRYIRFFEFKPYAFTLLQAVLFLFPHWSGSKTG